MPVPNHHNNDCKTVVLYPTQCKFCQKKIFYFECSCGSKVLFKELAPFWLKHSCEVHEINEAINAFKKEGWTNEKISEFISKESKDRNQEISKRKKNIVDGLLSQLSLDFQTDLFSTEDDIDVKNIPSDNLDNIRKLELKMLTVKPQTKMTISQRIERGIIAEKVKKLLDYKCLICEKLKLPVHPFLKKDGTPYIEVHHVIPVSTQEVGVLSVTNLITVCPNHHEQIHRGDVSYEIFDDRFHFTIDSELLEIKKFKLN